MILKYKTLGGYYEKRTFRDSKKPSKERRQKHLSDIAAAKIKDPFPDVMKRIFLMSVFRGLALNVTG